MKQIIIIVSVIIVLLGMVHISFAFPIHLNTGTLVQLSLAD